MVPVPLNSTGIDAGLARHQHRAAGGVRGRSMGASVNYDLGGLGGFKYADFTLENAQSDDPSSAGPAWTRDLA